MISDNGDIVILDGQIREWVIYVPKHQSVYCKENDMVKGR